MGPKIEVIVKKFVGKLLAWKNPHFEKTIIFYMFWGLNSHCFPMAGMVINLLVGVYVPIIRIPGFHIKGGMTIPNIRSFDPGTYQVGRKLVSPPSSFLLMT